MCYVLITPARNEEKYISFTLDAVVRQSVTPARWVIVSDGSTDRTVEIAKGYQKNYPFIHCIDLPVRKERNFAGKVLAIQKGFDYLTKDNVQFDYYGNLDADVSFDPDYYEQQLKLFESAPKLGIIGGQLYDYEDGKFTRLSYGLHSVAGPIQFFRKACYEDIGGYVASRIGLVDAIAEVSARMKGWTTHTFPDLPVKHHRKTGSEGRGLFRAALKEGKMDYHFGLHPIFHLGKSLRRCFKKPIVIGSFLRSFQYFWCAARSEERPVSNEFVQFLRNEEKETAARIVLGNRSCHMKRGPY